MIEIYEDMNGHWAVYVRGTDHLLTGWHHSINEAIREYYTIYCNQPETAYGPSTGRPVLMRAKN